MTKVSTCRNSSSMGNLGPVLFPPSPFSFQVMQYCLSYHGMPQTGVRTEGNVTSSLILPPLCSTP